MQNFGGNEIEVLPTALNANYIFADDRYYYSYNILKLNENLLIEDLKSITILLLAGKISINGIDLVDIDDSISINSSAAKITCFSDSASFLVVGSRQLLETSESVKLTKFDKVKKVIKPWGYENWYTAEKSLFCLKKIAINQGTKTSLQYHCMKRETNVLFMGKALLHYKANEAVDISKVQSADIKSTALEPVSVLNVYPLTIHRIEALTNIVLYEVSTPELDDVIRLSDDSNRQNGRIDSEHVSKH